MNVKPTSSDRERERVEQAVRNCYSTWGERYYDEYYKSDAAYPPVHTDIVRTLLQNAGARTLLDAGCGPASMLRDLVDLGLDLYGFDLTPEMIAEARRVLSVHGIASDRIWTGSVLERGSFLGAPDGRKDYDAGICFGVLPHVPDGSDAAVIGNFMTVVRPGGLVAIEARNELFSLFTLNRYSSGLFRNRLIDSDGLRAAAGDERDALERALDDLDKRFRMDLPPVRKGYADEPGYDEVLSRTHNPFEMRALAERLGLIDVRILFYHFHALPPMLESAVPKLFRRASIAMENPEDWRGHFLASAFILVGRVP
ncbi:class I SAM-dependent methyltransferase [Sulfuritalea sp.]|uniref:class I SAM-dependent methyltransferase n=1 Tax=Sulfuritalea sp. TaxID=2480090 RepID=UPI00286DC796|nr:class I SAM-dependent methyltransferase [Sulfuritalea sp.]